MLDDVRDQMLAWLEREPAMSAAAILECLKAAYPQRFTDCHLRTVQRALKVWRGQQARRIILENSTVIGTAVRDAQLAKFAQHPRVSPTGVHSDPPRIAASDAWRSLRDGRVPSVDSVDDTLPPALDNIAK